MVDKFGYKNAKIWLKGEYKNLLKKALDDNDVNAVKKALNNIDNIKDMHLVDYIKKDNGIVELLINKKINIGTTSKGGVTPLHIVSDQNNLEIAKLLLEHKANVNCANKDGVTPLDVAPSPEMTKLIEKYII